MATTFASIRDRIITVIEAATPANLTQHPFRYVPERDYSVREWAQSASDQVLRKFDLVRVGDSTEGPLLHPDEVQRRESFLITVAYPRLPSFYGANGLTDMEDIMRRDARSIRDLVYSGSTISGVTDWEATNEVVIGEPERDGNIWFQTIGGLVIYCESATYTA